MLVATCSLVVLPRFHLFFIFLFTTLFAIDMDYEELSILKTRKYPQARVVDANDSPNFDKFHLNGMVYKP